MKRSSLIRRLLKLSAGTLAAAALGTLLAFGASAKEQAFPYRSIFLFPSLKIETLIGKETESTNRNRFVAGFIGSPQMKQMNLMNQTDSGNGGAIYSKVEQFLIDACTFIGNKGTNNQGGAIFARTQRLLNASSAFIGNTAEQQKTSGKPVTTAMTLVSRIVLMKTGALPDLVVPILIPPKDGGEMQIRIRGQRSLTASNDPLVVLDEVQNIEPSDIESRDILKEAVYGSVDANGVQPGYSLVSGSSELKETAAAPAVAVVGAATGNAEETEEPAIAGLPLPFTDVADDAYYRDPVAFAVSCGITTGVSDTLFDPDGSCTRAQTVTFIWRMMGCPEPASIENPFEDISEDDYFFKAVLWAAEQGITTGTDDRHFSPDATVTREQAVTFLFRLSGSVQVDGILFFDDVEAGSYSREAIRWAVYAGIANGVDAEHFAPADPCTRAQIVTFIYRLAVEPLTDAPDIGSIVPLFDPEKLITSYDSLEELNAAFGCNLTRPGTGVTDEVFYSRDYDFGTEAIYDYKLGDIGYEYSFLIFDEEYDPIAADIYGVTDNVKIEEYGGFLSAAWYDNGGEYFFSPEEDIDEAGDYHSPIDKETFIAMAEEISGREAAIVVTDHLFDSVSQRATGSFDYILGRKDVILALIEWTDSADVEHMWFFTAYADEENPDKLFYTDCDYYVTTYDEEGNILTDEVVYYGGEGYIELDGDKVLWTGAADEFCQSCVFEAAE